MKRIVISCDGTWNRVNSRLPSNALRLARAVLPEGPGGVAQVVCHVDGVGTGRGTGRLSRFIDTTLGGALGFGIMANVVEAYRFLIFNYAPGDELFFFGYSRGAFTARSLVGLIRNSGILDRERINLLPKAVDLYQERGAGAHPNSVRSRAFRGMNAVGGEDFFPKLAYLGVWDTVGALGIPSHVLLARSFNRSFAFHDTTLTSKVEAARHAVAIDERRRTFQPALWSNLADLNGARERPVYQQMWFPGDHGCVGGGNSRPLANETLIWVAQGAMEAGLAISTDKISDWLKERNAGAPIPNDPSLLSRLIALGFRDRSGPSALGELSRAGVRRWHLDPNYRPGALRALAQNLDGDSDGSN